MKTPSIALCLLGATACFNHGVRPDHFDPAQGPEGARVAVSVTGEDTDRVGELIAVDSVGITIRETRLLRIAWRRIVALDVAQLGKDYDILVGEPVTSEKRARLALVSRFPQGLSGLPITIDSLIASAARATRPFVDRRLAVDAGYRRIGADFPGMGEHWLNVQTLLRGTIDPARPTLLIYADIRGQPTLLGVGFAAVTRGDSIPIHLPGWPEEWHEHSGLLAEESGALTGHDHGASETHVWVMHAWTALENPYGPTAAENWALPYARAGRAIPVHVDASAGRALALTVGGDEFVRKLVSDAGIRTDENSMIIDSVVAAARVRAATSTDDESLRDTWRMLRDDFSRLLGPRAAALLEPTHVEGHR